MNDNTLEQNGASENDDLSQNDELMEDALSKEINTDDSRSGGQEFQLELEKDQEIEKLQQELQEQKDKYLRLVAEFDNFRRRTAKERIEEKQLAGRDIMSSLLQVMDDSERAAKQLDQANDVESLRAGLSLVFNKLKTILQQRGLKAMDSINQPFDPDLHEAITEIPVTNEEQKGKVIDVVEPGYYLNDKLIRHAKVVVGK